MCAAVTICSTLVNIWTHTDSILTSLYEKLKISHKTDLEMWKCSERLSFHRDCLECQARDQAATTTSVNNKGYMSQSYFSLTHRLALNITKPVIRPPNIHVGALIFYQGFFFFLFFRQLLSTFAERNSTKTGHMLTSECDLKTHVQNLGYPLPLQIGGPKTTFFVDFTT